MIPLELTLLLVSGPTLEQKFHFELV